jgi:hypothetical protein
MGDQQELNFYEMQAREANGSQMMAANNNNGGNNNN